MKNEPTAMQRRATVTREHVRARINKIRASHQRLILGLPEMIGLAASLLLLLAAVFAYLFFLAPERSRLASLQLERARLQTQLRNSSEGIKRNTDTQASVEKIMESLQNFESKRLAPRSESRTGIIEELNDKIRRSGLGRAQLSFVHLDELAPGTPRQRTSTRGAKAEQTVFPSIGVSLTVEGSYPNLRAFIKGIEESKHFVVINAVELEDIKDSTSGGASRAATERVDSVSLRLDMAAYFRRSATDTGETLPSADATR